MKLFCVFTSTYFSEVLQFKNNENLKYSSVVECKSLDSADHDKVKVTGPSYININLNNTWKIRDTYVLEFVFSL